MTDTTDHPSRRAGLRDELRRAVCEAEGFAWDSDMLEPDEYGDHADTVLAVLYREWPWLRAEAEDAASVVVPAADRAALRDRIRRAIARQFLDETGSGRCVDELDDAEFGTLADAVLSVLPAPADRAAAEAVRALHQPTEGLGYDSDEDDTPGSYGRIAQACTSCGTPDEYGVRWPCPTIRALDAVESAAVDRVAAEKPALPSIHDRDVEGFCPACGHPTLRLGEDAHLTCTLMDCPKPDAADVLLGPAVEAQPGKDTETRIVAYRSHSGSLLYCTGHAGELFGLGYTAVTADDLPDGGICTHPDCGVDVLIPQQPKEA